MKLKRRLIKTSIGFCLLTAIIIGACFINASADNANTKVIYGVPTITVASLPANKAKALEKQEQLIATAASETAAPKNINAPNTDNATASAAITPDEIVPSGIHNGSDVGTAPLPSSEFLANNGWTGTVNNVKTAVFAGYSTPNPNQGIVILFDLSTFKISSYPTSSLDGGLTVTKADGNVLTLTSKNGTTYTLDMNKMVLTRQ